MRRFLIVAHGTFAEGIFTAMGILTGMTENVTAINCFCEGAERNPRERMEKFIEETPREDEIVILTDLFGGSVNNDASMLFRDLKRENLHIITGVNLALALELLLYPDNEPLAQAIEAMIEQARDGMKYVNTYMEEIIARSELATEQDDEDFFDSL